MCVCVFFKNKPKNQRKPLGRLSPTLTQLTPQLQQCAASRSRSSSSKQKDDTDSTLSFRALCLFVVFLSWPRLSARRSETRQKKSHLIGLFVSLLRRDHSPASLPVFFFCQTKSLFPWHIKEFSMNFPQYHMHYAFSFQLPLTTYSESRYLLSHCLFVCCPHATATTTTTTQMRMQTQINCALINTG